jgi:phospholipid/cholesterol/gamma-HCH transport system substrate-binding protein
MKRAIKAHLGDFIAILALLAFAIVVSGYILTKERLHFPLIESSPIKINAEFQTAQAFTPGQGQTVRVSGVEVGEVGQVQLKNGVAIVQMDIDQKYKDLIHKDATLLARPRTGLQDMFIELTPGTKNSPIAPEGYTIPVSQTQPEVNPDEVLSALDSDTRSYLDLLVNGAGQGLRKNGGNELAGVLQRFEPTHRDLARLNGAVAQRGVALQQLVNSLQRLNTALAAKQAQIVSLVDASAKVFHAFAIENQPISRAVQDLPGTLRQTTVTLGKVQTFANLLAQTGVLLPAVHAIKPANEALIRLAGPGATRCADPAGAPQDQKSSCGIVRDQIRPFVIAATPVIRHLRPAAINLAAATPNLSKTFTVLNDFFNKLGYCPQGGTSACGNSSSGPHGYLWWLAWLNHEVRTLFSVQDANGTFRPIFLEASCSTYSELLSFNPAAAALLAPAIAKACNLP